MGGRIKKSAVVCICFIAIASISLMGCGGGLLDYVKQTAAAGGTGGGGGGGGGGGSVVFSGKVLDNSTGAPIQGCQVQLGSYSTTSASDGSFSITASSAVTGPFLALATNYQFWYISSIQLPASTQGNIFMMPMAGSGAHNVKVYIYDAVEIPQNTTVDFVVMNSAGGMFSYPNASYVTGGYTVATSAWGSDCLIVATVHTTPQFVAMLRNQDLSSASTTASLGKSSSISVFVTGESTVSTGGLYLSTPYGFLNYTSFGLAMNPYLLTLYNPYSYQGYWSQSLSSSITGGYKYLMSTSNVGSIGTSVTLPALNHALGPSVVGAASTMSYSAGTLSVSPVTGATQYQFQLSGLGMVISGTPSVALPTALRAFISGKNVTTYLYPLDFSIAWTVANVLQGIHTQGSMPSVQMGETSTVSSDSKVMSY